MNILFVCRYNRFRSKFAEGFFNKYYSGNKHVARSVGLFRGGPYSEGILHLAKELDVNLTPNQEGLSSEGLEWIDMVVIVADDVPAEVFKKEKRLKGKKIVVWKIKDSDSNHPNKTRNIALEIEKRVKKMINKLKDY